MCGRGAKARSHTMHWGRMLRRRLGGRTGNFKYEADAVIFRRLFLLCSSSSSSSPPEKNGRRKKAKSESGISEQHHPLLQPFNISGLSFCSPCQHLLGAACLICAGR